MFDSILSRVITPKYINLYLTIRFLDVEVYEKSIRLRIATKIANGVVKEVFPSNNSKLSSFQLNDKVLLELKEYIDNNKDKVLFHNNCGDYGIIINDCIQNYHNHLRNVEVLKRIEKVIEGISELKDGWYNGEGTRFKIKDLNKAINLITGLIEKEIPEPNIFPTVTNGVRLEWTNQYKEYSYEMNLTTESGILSILNISNDKYIYEDIPMKDIDKIIKLIQDNMRGDMDGNMS